MRRDFEVYPDVDALSRAAADAIEVAAQRAVASRGRFGLTLSGGSTPRTLYQLLAADYRTRIPWSLSQLFFGDERCVPPNHPDSNYGMARDTLLAHIPGLEARTYRIAGERGGKVAAQEYDALLHTAFPGPDPVTFDIVLLGVGTDGHTCSLFPGSPTLDERARWAVPAEAPPDVTTTRARVTLTYPVLDAALEALILTAGPDKQPIIEHVRATEGSANSPYPIAHITARERVRWMIGASRGDQSS